MATDTARINLELASGRNEVTAPFHQTAQRRRKPLEQPLAEADTIVDVPLESRKPASTPQTVYQRVYQSAPEPIERPTPVRPTWIAFICAVMAVGAAVWWVMFQRLPDIDPREVIERNLGDARRAMAEGRYTDPPERSAYQHYSTVLALDPDNADARGGIEAIADRHLTQARVSLADGRIADAAVALEKAGRVRPNHGSLPELDMQLRAELRKILAAANLAPPAEPEKTKVANVSNKPPARVNTPSAPSTRPLRDVAPATPATKEPALLALAPVDMKQTSPSLITPAATESAASETGAPGSAPVVDEPANSSAAPTPLPETAPTPEKMVQTVTPKLIKMVQPEYPQEAIMRGIEGWVDVSLEVNAAGDVIAPRIEDSSRGRLFNRAAVTAVQQWKYEPRMDGATNERVRVRLQFRLSK